ncbi:MAG: carbohydrate ABC transporter substrate-binding protein [Clostridia bacterium]|nr:carbohydrate ABC transporter substrate-binding protein [Clostridia bacterium]MBQ6171967.1 carbohydrate ABC transporter substrate-binding protein [Clostridia bacterium]
MKRIISLTLSVLMLLSLIVTVSCSSQSAEEFDVDLEADLQVDLTGQHYVWGSSWNEQLLPSAYFSLAGDMTHKRLKDLTEKYGCTFDVIPWEDGSGRIITETAAGYSSIDFLDSHASNGGIHLYRAGLLYSLDEIPNLERSDNRFGTPRFLQYGVFDGRFYGFYQYAWEFPPEYHGVIHFNSDMLRTLGLRTPHELHENGEWDWAHFKDFLMSVQSAASYASYEADFVPFICGTSYAADAIGFMFANGLQMIEGTNGNYTFGFDNPAGIAAIEFLADLYKEGLYVTMGAGEFVKNKKSALMSHESYFSTHYNEKSSSNDYLPAQDYAYGMIRFPYGPNGDENCVSGYVHHGRRLNWILNCTDKDISDIGLVLNFVFAPLDGSIGWEGLLKSQIFYSSDDLDEYSYMLENINFNYDGMFLEKGYDTWTGNVNSAVTGRKSVSEVFDSASTAIQEAINKNVTWTFDELISE